MKSMADMPPSRAATSARPASSRRALLRWSGGDQPGQRHAPDAAEDGAGVGQAGIGLLHARRPSSSSFAAPAHAPRCRPRPPARRSRGGAAPATRRPATPSSMPSRQSRGSSGRQKGSRRSCRAMADSISAASRTVRVIGPAQATDGEGAERPLRDAPEGGLQPDQPAPGRRDADGAAGIGADMQRPEARRPRRPGADEDPPGVCAPDSTDCG